MPNLAFTTAMIASVVIIIDIVVVSSTICSIIVSHAILEMTLHVAHFVPVALLMNILHDALFSAKAQPIHLSALKHPVNLFLHKKRLKIV